ncbi:hypothetical protein [Pararhizobium sp.]|uniref:hypothetical protein n=1 Tax=Pararhizobium sp. TaxID=1977563 RepID=UPI003D14D929
MKKPLRPQPEAQRTARAVSVRAMAGAPTSVDSETRSFDIIVTTETPVRTWIDDPREPGKELQVDEVLLTDGLDYSRTPRMSLCDGHDTGSVDKVLGKVTDVRAEDKSIVARATLTRRRADLLEDIADGIYGQISAGYTPLDTEIVERDGDVPLALVKSWLLTEASIVTVAADENAFIRSAGPPPKSTVTFRAAAKPKSPQTRLKATGKPRSQEKTTMTKLRNKKRSVREDVAVASEDLEAVVSAAEDAVAAAEEAIAAVDEIVDGATDAPEELLERARALRGKRADEDDADKADDEERKRADEEEDEPTEAEAKEEEEIRSIARSYGLTKLVKDMRSLGARPVEMKRALRTAIAGRSASASTTSASDRKPAEKRSAAPAMPSVRSIYDVLNKRK